MRHFTWMKTGFIVALALWGLSSCEKDNDLGQKPLIGLDSETAIYKVKIGKTITISPSYQNCGNAVYAWKMDGKIIGTAPELTFPGDELGDYFLSVSAVNSEGEAYVELKVSVVDLLLPQISMALPSEGYSIIKGSDLAFTPTVENDENATYSWSVNGSKVATTKAYTFNSSSTGDYALQLTVTNEDGMAQSEIPVKVCNAEDLPFSWDFEQESYSLSQGRSIRIKIWDIKNAFDATFSWSVDGKAVQTTKVASDATSYLFDLDEIGKHTLTVTMENSYGTLTKQLDVEVCAPEGTYKRLASSGSSAQWNKVYAFLGAPGQFINEGYTATTMEQAAAYAETRMRANGYVSLGGFGGYLVVGFDHSIENDGSYNIQIQGNSFAGSSEPGIVWVMQDENGNALPDDTWYELKGSEYGLGREIRDYAVTYYKPAGAGMSVQWTDNQGQSGVVDYLGFHTQDYYYPNWVSSSSYTLRGTCLPASNRETTPGYWYNGEFEWGYADNFSSIDRLTDDINYGAAANGNHFKISDAVTYDGRAANLKYVDFVKVVTGVNCKSGWLGEVSTEVFNVKDFNLLKK